MFSLISQAEIGERVVVTYTDGTFLIAIREKDGYKSGPFRISMEGLAGIYRYTPTVGP